MAHWIEREVSDLRIADIEVAHGYYLTLSDLFDLMEDSETYERILFESKGIIAEAPGSSHNHQAWPGGYMDHVLEVMNIACQQYQWMSRARKLPFTRSQALQVLFLHDIEKPWKYSEPGTIHVGDAGIFLPEEDQTFNWRALPTGTKEERKAFRAAVIKHYNVQLTPEQENALEYVEGVPDSKYTPGERTMGELAAFVHCCDILSARLWYDKGKDVPVGQDRWE
jgi:hypothetical protein